MGAQIINGEDAKECDWIWQVQLKNPSGNVICGGSLISEKWILTAAHCTFGKMGASDLEVSIGNYIRVGSSSGAKARSVARIVHHPSFNARWLRNDVSLLELSSPIALGGCIGTVCLPEADAPVTEGTECWITGWGTTKIGWGQEAYAQNLQEAKLTTVNDAECTDAYPKYTISEDMVCANAQKSDGQFIDACHGDYGGPLVCQRSGAWYIHGVSSFSYGCARGTHPGVWARTSQQRDWIHKVTGI